MIQFMVDTETGGTLPDSVIAQVGLCIFDPDKSSIISSHRWWLDVDEQEKMGRMWDDSTKQWWKERPLHVYEEVWHPNSLLIYSVTDFCLSLFYQMKRWSDQPIVWANSPSFDCMLLRDLFAQAKIEVPWKYYNERDYRTVKALFPNIPNPKENTTHEAMADAVAQAEHLILMLTQI